QLRVSDVERWQKPQNILPGRDGKQLLRGAGLEHVGDRRLHANAGEEAKTTDFLDHVWVLVLDPCELLLETVGLMLDCLQKSWLENDVQNGVTDCHRK